MSSEARVIKSPNVWERKAAEKAEADFRKSPAAAAVEKLRQQLEQRIKPLEAWRQQLRGENGVEIKDTVISLNRPINRDDGGNNGGANVNDLYAYITVDGAPVLYIFTARPA